MGKYCNGTKDKSELCLFIHSCKAEKINCTTSEDLEEGRMVYVAGDGEYCCRDDDGFYEDSGIFELYRVDKNGAIGWFQNLDSAKKVAMTAGVDVEFVTDKKVINRAVKFIDYTSGYERCLTCSVLFNSWEDRGECSLYWRPYSGTKYGFPKDGWNCPMDTFNELVNNENHNQMR